jgi:hypothetical protein
MQLLDCASATVHLRGTHEWMGLLHLAVAIEVLVCRNVTV